MEKERIRELKIHLPQGRCWSQATFELMQLEQGFRALLLDCGADKDEDDEWLEDEWWEDEWAWLEDEDEEEDEERTDEPPGLLGVAVLVCEEWVWEGWWWFILLQMREKTDLEGEQHNDNYNMLIWCC